MRLYRLGLTGGIGSGKSTAAKAFERMGASVIDADAISRSVTSAGGAAIEPVRQAFGDGAIDSHGAMDRAFVRGRVFADAAAKAAVEAIIHPLVRQASAQALKRALDAANSGERLPWVVHDVPLLIESGRWRGALDSVLVIDCLPATQIARAVARSAGMLTQAQVQAVIDAQASRAQRLAAADHVVFNDGLTLAEFEQALHALAKRLQVQPREIPDGRPV